MKHSNRDEVERYYQKQLNMSREEKRRVSIDLEDQDSEADAEEVKGKSVTNSLSCTLMTLAIVFLAGYVIYYVYLNIKGPVIDEITKRQTQLEGLVNQGAESTNQIDGLIEKGDETIKQVNEAQEKLSKLRAALLTAKEAISSLTKKNSPEQSMADIIDGEKQIIQNKELTKVYPEDYVPYWLYQMREKETATYKVPDFRCEYLEDTVYLALGGETGCADCYTDYFYKADGQYWCAASGGLTGEGDGRCPGVFYNLTDCNIWNGEKWEKTLMSENKQ